MNEDRILHDPVFGVIITLGRDPTPAPWLPDNVRRFLARFIHSAAAPVAVSSSSAANPAPRASCSR
jgi:hypothetical protein